MRHPWLLLSMGTLKFLLLLCLWYKCASAQITGIDNMHDQNCSVTIVDDTAINVTLTSNVNGTFQCMVDEGDLETCNSGDRFEDLSEGVHSILIQFTPAGVTQTRTCLNQNFTISSTSTSFEFEVKFLYVGNDIILTINSSTDGIFCCQLDRGTCIRCVSGFPFQNVPPGSHTVMVQGASATTPQLTKSVTLEIPEFTVAADVLGSTITLLISPGTDGTFRCRLDDNDPVTCSNGSQFRGVSAGQHIIEVEKIDSAEQSTASVMVDVSERVVSFTNTQFDVDQASQNYTFNFTLTGESSDMIRFNFLNASNQSLIPHSCNRIMGTNYNCSIRLSESVEVGYHDITIQAVRDEIVYGEITERFFVFRNSTITFKEGSYEVKEDDERFNVTIQKFGLTNESVTVSIRTRASNPTSATPSTDYPTNPGTVVFEAGSTSEMIVELTVEPDDIFETNETYVLTLFVPRSIRERQSLELLDTEPIVTIVNDDNVTVNLQPRTSAVREGSTHIANIIVEPTTLMATFDVMVQTYFCGGCNGANPGTDYTPVNQTVTLGPGNTVAEIMISVLEDIFTESNDEVICVRIVLPERSQVAGALINSSDTNFTIINNNQNLPFNLSFFTISTSNQNDTGYSISVHYSAILQQDSTFNCRLNNETFSPCDLPQVYSNLPYDLHTVTVQAVSDGESVTTIEQKVLMVMGEIGVLNGTAVIVYIQSTLPATYRCRLNDGEYFSCSDREIIANLSRGNYSLTVETTSIELMASEVLSPVFVFGPDVVEGQSAAALCSGSANFSSMDVFYTASWRAREDRVDFVLVANVSKQWLAIGFTDKQMMKFDSIIGATDNNGTYFVDDRNAIAGGKPIRDSEQNVENASVLFDNGVTTVRFSRQKNTGDEDDFSLDVCRYFIFSWGDVIDIITGEIVTEQSMGSDIVTARQRSISDELICLPISTTLCPELFDCGEPGEPLNGTVQVVGGNLEGSVANYVCNDGHLLIGESRRTCTSNDSVWTGSVPECQFVDCGHPGTPSNGSSNFTSTILDATVTHSCDSGYVLCNGDDTRTCQPDMSWSGILPKCIRVTVTVSNSTNYVVDETDGAVNITLMFDRPSCQSVTIIARPQVRSIPDATVDDFDNTTVTITIDPGETMVTVSIPIIDDSLLESREDFDVVIEIGGMDTDGAVVGQPRVAQVTIVSEDVVMVSFTESEYNETEGAGSMRIGVQLSRVLQQMIIIQVATAGITAEGNGIDFDSTIQNVTFSPGDDISFAFIPIIDNNAVEILENFSLFIQIPPEFAEIGVQPGALNMATGFIVNDDVDCGSLNNPANGQVSFTETFGGSVANYSCDQGFVLCEVESRTCQSNGSWSGSPPECIRTNVTVDESMPYIVFENESSVDINLLLDRPSCRPITIIANPQEQSPPSATVDDFNDTSVRVTVNPGETTATISIMIIDDDLLELTELFDVEFSIEDTTGAEIREPRIAEIAILNDDDIVAMFTEGQYNASEGAGMIIIGVELNKESPQNIVLQLIVMPITAEGNGVDIESNSRNITFERGRRTVNLIIPINDDNIFEQVETVMFSLQVPPDLRMIGVQLGVPSQVLGIIFDDEADCGEPESPENGMVSFVRTVEGSVANYTCDEGYILDGVTQRVCGEDDQWTGDVPLCQIVSCNSPPMPTNGNVFAPSTTFGSTATHTCDAGFLLCGANRTCQSNGSWSGSTPECIRIMITVQGSVTREENLGTADIPLTLDRASCLPITVIALPQVRKEPDATENDFDNSTVTVIINPGETTATVSIPLIDDDLLESTELFNVHIEIGANDTDYVVVSPPGFSQVQIVNEDLLTVRFTETVYNVSEGEGVMTIGIVLNRPSPQIIIIPVVITENTAEGGGIDVDSQDRDVTFERGSIREFVNISINDDNLVEPTETFMLSFRITQGMRRMGISTTVFGAVAAGIITDDDVDCGSLENPDDGRVEISSDRSVADYTCNRRHILCGTDSRVCQLNGSWSGSPPECIRAGVTVDDSVDYTVREDSSSVNIIILLDQPSCQTITVIANPQVRSPPSATADDFNTTEVRVTINPGENSTVVPIGIINDDLFEDMEQFNVRFSTSTNIGVVMRQPRVAVVTIVSEEVAFVSFTQQQYNVSEDAGLMVIGVRLNREIQRRIAVQIRLTGNSAEGNEIDFRSNRLTVAFQRGVIMQNVSIPIINDDIVEEMENFSLSIQISQRFSAIGVRQGIPATAIGFIIDDDVDCGDPGQPANGNVSFVTTREGGMANYTCNEGYNLTGLTQRICQSNGSWSGDVPTCQIVDCGPLGIPTNGMTIINTTTFGSVAEHSCLDGFLLCGSQSRICQASGLWSGSLPDCIMVTVTLEDTTYQVSEDDGFVEIRLLLDQPACVSISVVVQPEIHMFGDPENIASEDDFNISSTIAVFNPGEVESAVFIAVINDLDLEQDELFDVVLIDSNDTGVNIGMPRTAEVTIMNSNMLTVAFSQEVYSVNESEGRVTVALELSRPAGQNITVGVQAIPNTAQGNNLDFDSMRKMVIFGPNDTLSFLDISITNDAELESEENFTLRIQLSRVTVRIGVELGDPSETVVVIIDDDEAISVEFEQSSYMVNEKFGHIEICLLSSGQNNADIIVMIQPQETVPVSARASSDFENTVSLVQFDPGEVMNCYNQTIIDDSVPEFLETFDLVILANSVIMAGNQSTSQITIIDDDIKGNDTIIGDPVYTVPLQISPEMMAANPNLANLSLCYEIHGRANSFFNLVSDQCVSITAEYLQAVNNSRLNVIGKIGVLAVDNNGDCQRITVDGNGCVASVGGTAVTQTAPYNNSGIRVRMNRQHYRIAVPNCELQDLVVWAICEEQNSLKFVITRGFNLQPTSHGLVAQFWNIPVELSSFTGPTPNNETGYYTVKVTPADGDVREFIGSLYPLTWDYTETPCLYAGNQQGGNAIEFKDFSDSVIEGFYLQYTVNSLFGTEFVFSQFDNSQCTP